MKRTVIAFAFIGSILGISSCGGNEEQSTEQVKEEKACFYSYNKELTVLEWTAFKFTEKKGVTGTFNEINISGVERSDDPKKLIESLTFTIPTATVETQNEERNGKIAKLFFGTIGTEEIRGNVTGWREIFIQRNDRCLEVERWSRDNCPEYCLQGPSYRNGW